MSDSTQELPWKGIMIRIENEAFTGLSYSVPGWECIYCGARYGSAQPPNKCWKCEGDNNQEEEK